MLKVAQRLGLKTVQDLEERLAQAAERARPFFEAFNFASSNIATSGSASHYASVLLIAANRQFFHEAKDFPFTSAEYISGINQASQKVFGAG